MPLVARPRRQRHSVNRVLIDSTLDNSVNTMPVRQRPNILITGTPGTGKTTHAELVASETGFKHINVGELVKEHQLHAGYDQEFDTYLLDEDKVNDHLEDIIEEGGFIVDHHSCDFFPQRWFDLVIVLQTDNTMLFDRLKNRGYSDKKITENVQCEIMNVVAEEAHEAYDPQIIKMLKSNDTDDMENNVSSIVAWAQQYCSQHT